MFLSNISNERSITMKTCKTCNETKELEEYYQDKAYKGGYRPTCKRCYRTARKRARDELSVGQREDLKERWRKSSRESYRRRVMAQ